MRRVVGTVLVVVLLVTGLGVGVVAGLSATTFGAASFVRVYLEAVARGDAAGALAIRGVTVAEDARTDFLVDATLDGLADLREVAVEPGDDGTTLVTFSWRAPRGEGVSTFAVERDGATLGVFPRWRFAESPVAILRPTIENDDRFRVARVPTRAEAEPAGYAVLVPGVYRVDHRSHYLRADALDLVVDRPGSELGATLEVQPALVFTIAVTAEVKALLDGCATQEVLFPTGCPLGHAIANRVVSPPDWSIAAYPAIQLEATGEPGVWRVPDTAFTSRLRVEVQSLFDGSVSSFDRELPASAGYLVTILADDATLRIEFAD